MDPWADCMCRFGWPWGVNFAFCSLASLLPFFSVSGLTLSSSPALVGQSHLCVSSSLSPCLGAMG